MLLWLVVAFGRDYDDDCDVVVESGEMVSTQVDIVSPLHLGRYDLNVPIPVTVEVSVTPAWVLMEPKLRLCSRFDSEPPECATLEDARARRWPRPVTPLTKGSHTLEAYVAIIRDHNMTRRLDCHLFEHDSVGFDVISEDFERSKNGATVASKTTVVTAADETYFNRLSNLVGSLQQWEPDLMMDIYDLGLSESSLFKARSWVGVSAVRNEIPCELLADVALVRWKFWVLLDALKRYERVLWLDANFEVRQSLASIFEAMDTRGYFLTVAGHRFPTPKTVRPATLDFFKCPHLTHASKIECTSAAIGVVRNSSFHNDVIPKVHDCSEDRNCIYPKDAIGNTNNRRDQSALNAALYCNTSKDDFICDPDRRFWMWHGQKTFLPTDDPQQSNNIVLFSRRGHGSIYSPQRKAT